MHVQYCLSEIDTSQYGHILFILHNANKELRIYISPLLKCALITDTEAS